MKVLIEGQPFEIAQWLIRTDQPYQGSSQSFLLPDGTVAYTDGLTPRQYAEDRGFPVRVVSDAQLEEMDARYVASLVTAPTEEAEADFWEALEMLPPCRWHTCRGVELFHISERLTHDLVSWHARIGERFFHMTHHAGADSEVLADAVRAAAAEAA